MFLTTNVDKLYKHLKASQHEHAPAFMDQEQTIPIHF